MPTMLAVPMAPARLAFVRYTSLNCAPVKSAPARLAPLKFAPVRLTVNMTSVHCALGPITHPFAVAPTAIVVVVVGGVVGGGKFVALGTTACVFGDELLVEFGVTTEIGAVPRAPPDAFTPPTHPVSHWKSPVGAVICEAHTKAGVSAILPLSQSIKTPLSVSLHPSTKRLFGNERGVALATASTRCVNGPNDAPPIRRSGAGVARPLRTSSPVSGGDRHHRGYYASDCEHSRGRPQPLPLLS